MKNYLLTLVVVLVAGFALDSRASGPGGGPLEPPEFEIGERLFLETRFAQFFAVNSGGNANAVLAQGDPVLDTFLTPSGPRQGNFAGLSMNCRACHLVNEEYSRLGNRTYADFARRSPVPVRGDGQTLTLRNSPALVGAFVSRPGGLLLHFDGEFGSGTSLSVNTLTGRNFGWLPSERDEAIAHIAHIIRNDDGLSELSQDFGGRYSDVLAGAASVPTAFRLPVGFRINVATATDRQIVTALGRLIDAYVKTLTFARDAGGRFSTSPYDVFLQKNKLPRKPDAGETTAAYSRRLFGLIRGLKTIQYVSNEDRTFAIHARDFNFGPNELAGLKIFFTGPGNVAPSPFAVAVAGSGNCVTCHQAPNFTDFKFHNTGASQEEYDGIHGAGTFAALTIPTHAERRANLNNFLPPSPARPAATGVFASIPVLADPSRADLGLWNIIANPDHPTAQPAILRSLTGGTPVSYTTLLPKTIGRFKTPSLRDLADSNPFLHNGSKLTIEDVLNFYRDFGDKTRAGLVRNPAPQLQGIILLENEIAPLAAFLRSLTEDYQ